MSLESSIENIIKSTDVDLYDIEISKEGDHTYFRVYITSKDGINLDKCGEISELISPILDVEEPMRGKYFFEVSSPGLERKLKKIKHYKLSVGSDIKVKTLDKETIEGILNKVEKTSIFIDDREINFDDIKSAQTTFKW